MGSIPEVMQLCRLCLMKDDVNNLIFEDEDNISQIFLKISACLPIKVARDDTLPKKICDSCSYKLELLYDFLHTVTTSEKQLITLLKQLEDDPLTKVISHLPLTRIANVAPIVMKQELPDLIDTHSVDDITPSEDLNITVETEDYVLQQQQSPYESVEFEFQQERFIDNNDMNIDDSTTDIGSGAIKRKRQNIALKRLPTDLDSDEYEEDEDNDFELPDSKIAKIEDDSEVEQTPFVHLTSTTSDNDQPGPSGLGKTVGDGSYCSDHLHQNNRKWANCHKICKSKLQLKKHYPYCKPKTLNENFRCWICDHYTDSKTALRNHEQEHPKRCIECNLCGKIIADKFKLILHKKRHLNNYSYICHKCGKGYYTELHLLSHMNVEHEGQLYECCYCSKQYKDRNHYHFHVNKHLGLSKCKSLKANSTRQYMCYKCGKILTTLPGLKFHMKTHFGIKPFKCNTCNKCFTTSSTYTVHLKTHTENSFFTCYECNQSFTAKSSLVVHVRNHLGDKPYVCKICNKGFISQSRANRHMVCHAIGLDKIKKPHICLYCNKQFLQKYMLTEHERTHSGERPFLCSVCAKTFMTNAVLKKHMNLHE